VRFARDRNWASDGQSAHFEFVCVQYRWNPSRLWVLHRDGEPSKLAGANSPHAWDREKLMVFHRGGQKSRRVRSLRTLAERATGGPKLDDEEVVILPSWWDARRDLRPINLYIRYVARHDSDATGMIACRKWGRRQMPKEMPEDMKCYIPEPELWLTAKKWNLFRCVVWKGSSIQSPSSILVALDDSQITMVCEGIQTRTRRATIGRLSWSEFMILMIRVFESRLSWHGRKKE